MSPSLDPSPAADAAPPSRPARSLDATTGQRVAGGFLLVNALLTLGWLLAGPAATATVALGDISPAMTVVPAVIDLLVGTSLARGRKGLVALATLRAGLGGVLFTAMQIHEPASAAAQVLLSGAVLLLLLGDAGRVRVALGAAVFAIYALLGSVGLVALAVGSNPLRGPILRAMGEIEAPPGGTVRGAAYPYTLELPGLGWFVRKDEAARKDQPLADRWLMRPDRDAHLLVIVEHVPGKVLPVDAYADAALEGQRQGTTTLELVDRVPLRTDPVSGRLLHTRFQAKGVSFERLMAVVAVGERGFQIIATVERSRFPKLDGEMRDILESFLLPPEAANLSPASGYEAAPVRQITGSAYPYRLTAPANRRWYLRMEEAARQDQPLADRWLSRPDLQAHVLVIAEHLPGAKVAVDAAVDEALKGMTGRAAAFELKSREPLAGDPARGRLLRVSVTINKQEMEFVVAIVSLGDRVIQVMGSAARATFPQVEPELREIIASLRLPEPP